MIEDKAVVERSWDSKTLSFKGLDQLIQSLDQEEERVSLKMNASILLIKNMTAKDGKPYRGVVVTDGSRSRYMLAFQDKEQMELRPNYTYELEITMIKSKYRVSFFIDQSRALDIEPKIFRHIEPFQNIEEKSYTDVVISENLVIKDVYAIAEAGYQKFLLQTLEEEAIRYRYLTLWAAPEDIPGMWGQEARGLIGCNLRLNNVLASHKEGSKSLNLRTIRNISQISLIS